MNKIILVLLVVILFLVCFTFFKFQSVEQYEPSTIKRLYKTGKDKGYLCGFRPFADNLAKWDCRGFSTPLKIDEKFKGTPEHQYQIYINSNGKNCYLGQRGEFNSLGQVRAGFNCGDGYSNALNIKSEKNKFYTFISGKKCYLDWGHDSESRNGIINWDCSDKGAERAAEVHITESTLEYSDALPNELRTQRDKFLSKELYAISSDSQNTCGFNHISDDQWTPIWDCRNIAKNKMKLGFQEFKFKDFSKYHIYSANNTALKIKDYDAANNQYTAFFAYKWDQFTPINIENNTMYSYINDKKCHLHFQNDKVKSGQKNILVWDCNGKKSTILIEDNNVNNALPTREKKDYQGSSYANININYDDAVEELINRKINEQYNLDMEAIRNLGSISKSLLTGKNYHNINTVTPGTLTIPANMMVQGWSVSAAIGTIIMWGLETPPPPNVNKYDGKSPYKLADNDVWAPCNGQNGTPDLRDRFPIGHGAWGEQRQVLGGNVPLRGHSHNFTTANAGTHRHTQRHSMSNDTNQAHYYGADDHPAWTHYMIGVDDAYYGNDVVNVQEDGWKGRKVPQHDSYNTTTENGSHTHTGKTSTTNSGHITDNYTKDTVPKSVVVQYWMRVR